MWGRQSVLMRLTGLARSNDVPLYKRKESRFSTLPRSIIYLALGIALVLGPDETKNWFPVFTAKPLIGLAKHHFVAGH